MLESRIFRQISVKLFPKTKKQNHCRDLVLEWAVLQKNVFICSINEERFTQHVGEVASSIYLAVYWPTAQSVATCLGNKDEIYVYPLFL